MFLLRSSRPTPTGTNLNAILPIQPQDADTLRTERNLGVCQRLVELGMQMAERAATVAMQDLATLKTTNPNPEAAKTQTQQADEATIPFTRLMNGIRQTVALETRIALIAKATTRKPDRDPVPMDWDAIRQALHMTGPGQTPPDAPAHQAPTCAEPDAAEPTHATQATQNPAPAAALKPRYRPTQEELEDPTYISPDDQEILSLCEELGITIDFTNLDELNELHNSQITVPLDPYRSANPPRFANPPHRANPPAPPYQPATPWPARARDEKT